MEFSYQMEVKDNIIIVSLQGELIEKFQAQALLEELEIRLQESNRIILTLQDLKYLNSSGLNVLINILTRFRTAGGEAVVCCLSKKVNELFLITKLNSVFTVLKDLDESDAYFKSTKEKPTNN
ncbi:MAG: STAS domain-containing protein [Bacteroidetes bacterium]|nr:STAS domain-containing protein [Bacteroidota bacterium]HET6245110.1 STAS domain-containing protein [Bacteroidia bacterium]